MSKSKRIPQVTKKLAYIEGLRALAALYVVISHICSMIEPYLMSIGKSVVPPSLRSLMAPFWHGHLAVAAFIVLSGFSLQYGLYQRDDGRVYGLRKYYKRRALRILPAYYGCLVLSIGFCYWITIPNGNTLPFKNYLPLNGESILTHVFLVHNWSIGNMYKINGALWSIPIEFQLYLVFPFLVVVMKRVSPLALLALAAIPAFLVIAFIPAAVKMYSWFAILFVFGMIAAHLAYRPHPILGQRPLSGLIWTACGAIATAIIVGTSLRAGRPFDGPTMISSDITFGLSTATLLYTLTTYPGTIVERLLNAKWLVGIGTFSYSVYLLHHPLIQAIYVNRPGFAQSPTSAFFYLTTIGVLMILGFSWVFSLFFERPFVKSALPKTRELRTTGIALPLRAIGPIRTDRELQTYAYLAGPDEQNKSGSTVETVNPDQFELK